MKILTGLACLLVLCWAYEEDKITNANNEFGLRLLRVLPSTPEKNVFFSPYSVSTAMGMAFAGARGRTQQELFQALGYSDAGLNDAGFLGVYARHTDRLKTSPSNSTLDVANAAAIQRTLALLDSYEIALGSAFGAELHKVDFAEDQQATVDFINNWVKQKTHHKIDKLFNEPLDGDTQLVLLNAIYFKGSWNTEFEKEATEKRRFFNGGVTPVEVDTMKAEIRVNYRSYDDLHVDVVELPYRGLDYSMVIMLPKEKTGVEALKQNLTFERFNQYVSDLRGRKVTIFLPRFKLETKYSLKTALQSLGINLIFGTGADLSGINDQKLMVSAVEHKALVEVNEEGTEAAAATGVVVIPYSLGPGPVEFRVDHPFLFFIRNTQTGDIFFAGQNRSIIAGTKDDNYLTLDTRDNFALLFVTYAPGRCRSMSGGGGGVLRVCSKLYLALASAFKTHTCSSFALTLRDDYNFTFFYLNIITAYKIYIYNSHFLAPEGGIKHETLYTQRSRSHILDPLLKRIFYTLVLFFYQIISLLASLDRARRNLSFDMRQVLVGPKYSALILNRLGQVQICWASSKTTKSVKFRNIGITCIVFLPLESAPKCWILAGFSVSLATFSQHYASYLVPIFLELTDLGVSEYAQQLLNYNYISSNSRNEFCNVDHLYLGTRQHWQNSDISSALRAPRAFVYPTDAPTYFYLPFFLTNDDMRFSASSSRVLCASFMLPAHWRSIFCIYFFTTAPDNILYARKTRLVDLHAVKKQREKHKLFVFQHIKQMKILTALACLLVICWAHEGDKLTNANNEFGLRLLRVLPSTQENNVFFSPYSVSTAMGMAFAGARGRTQQELFQALGYSDAGLTDAGVLSAYAHHTDRLKTTPSNSTLDVENAADIQQTLALLDSYESTLGSTFGAELHKVDFIEERQATVDFINNWVNQKTHDNIEKLLNEPLDSDTQLVLLNAIYYKGAWHTEFEKEATEKRQFFNGGVTPVDVDTMKAEIFVNYWSYDDLHVDVVELPYRGLDYSMVILLPKEKTGVEALKHNLTLDRFKRYVSGLRGGKVALFLPR
ncbi:unnamed protein product [Ixodes hexagonus]